MLYRITDFEKKTPSKIDYDLLNLSSGDSIKVYSIEIDRKRSGTRAPLLMNYYSTIVAS